MVIFNVEFLGTTVVDRRFSNPMIPWVVADIKKRKQTQKIKLNIDQGKIIGEIDDVILFEHDIQNLVRFCLEPNYANTFMHLVRDRFEPVFNVYLFQAQKYDDVMEVFQTLRENTRDASGVTKSHSSAASLVSLCPDISPTNSQFFEVLYVGKMKVSHKKVPETFIDDALEKFRLYEVEKTKKQLYETNESSESEKLKQEGTKSEDCKSQSDKILLSDENKSNDIGRRKGLLRTLTDDSTFLDAKTAPDKSLHSLNEELKHENSATSVAETEETSKNKSECHSKENVQDKKIKMNRSGSLGMIETLKKRSDYINQNRTMLFYVGRTDIRLISPDRKQVLLNKMLREINCCVQGIQNNKHFGIISREIDGYFGYVFKCESNCVADHIVSAILQSFQAIKEAKDRTKQQIVSCEHCPMVWFHKLCAEMEVLDQSDKKRQLTILKKIETLPDHEQNDIYTKFLGAESSDIKDQNEFLMILLRTHCERKQSRHIHDTEETRSEFLNQVLGGNTIFMKAKRSLTSSFDHLLKRKSSQQDILHSKELGNRKSENNSSSIYDDCHRSYLTVGSADGEIMKKEISKHMNNRMQNLKKIQNGKRNFSEGTEKLKKTSSLQETSDFTVYNSKEYVNEGSYAEENSEADASKTPLMNIFLKVGSASKTNTHENRNQEETNQTPSGSWRQAIFNRVMTPGKTDEAEDGKPLRKNKEQLRCLWRTAINQQILLIRMEKENARLKARQEEVTVKRIKLEYDEMGNFTKEQLNFWDIICSKDNKITLKCDVEVMLPYVRQGIPRARRGDAWHYLANHYCSQDSQFDSSDYPNYDVPYEDLLKQLTSFQHTILIDLGRTFPNHPYFSSPLGPGQLALFNLLKAYSLLDSQVGYCQGLSFVAGVLLLHLFEDQAFLLLRHLMLKRNLRKQYLPDMAALQVQLYQLSRLIHDSLPKLYAHFDKNEISPTLYAASWMLTLFASQFPLGFVTRVFDLLFVEQPTDVIFKVIMALLEEHSSCILKLSNFEEIMNYLKFDIPKMDATFVDKLMKKVLSLDISKQIHEYEVEYHVLQEEISTPKAELDRLKKVEVENKKLLNENLTLQEEIEVMTKNLNKLEKLRLTQQGAIRKLETKTKTLEIAVKCLGNFITEIKENNKDIDIPDEISRIISSLELGDNELNKTINSFGKSEFFKRIQSVEGFYEKPTSYEFCAANGLTNGAKFLNQSNGLKEINHNVNAGFNNKIKNIGFEAFNDCEKKAIQRSSNLPTEIASDATSFSNSTTFNGLEISQVNENTLNEIKTIKSHKNNIPSLKHETLSDIKSIKSKETNFDSEKNEILTRNKMCSNTETIKESRNENSHLHPLGSLNGVDITFNGTTKLKSIKSGHELLKNKGINIVPVNNQLLRIAEDGDS